MEVPQKFKHIVTYDLIAQFGKESACNAEDPSLIPGLGRCPGEGIGYPIPVFLVFLGGSSGKESTCKVGDLDLICHILSILY